MTDYSLSDFRRDMRNGQFAWPGGYQLYFVVDDGEALSFDAARENRRQIIHSIANKVNDGWRVLGVDVNYEDTNLHCAHTGQSIPASYGE